MNELTVVPISPTRREYYWGSDLRFVFDRIHSTPNGLTAYVLVHRISNVPAPTVLAHGRYDLMSSRTVPSLTRAAEAVAQDKYPFAALLTQATLELVMDHLDEDPPVDLTHITEPPVKWLLRPLIGGTQATSILAPGGTGKSVLTLSAALTVATGRSGYLGLKPLISGPVLYLDWEADAETHAERMRGICAGAKQPVPEPGKVFYRASRGQLRQSADSVAGLVAKEGVVMLVVDSVMLARQGDAFGPQDTTDLFAALRHIGVPSLLVDHKSREAIRKGWKGAYGSVVNDNSLRLSWEVVAETAMPGGGKALRFENVKHNNVRKQTDLGFEFAWENDDNDHLISVDIRQVAAGNVVALPEAGGTQAEQILTVIVRADRAGMSIAELVDETDIRDASVRSRLAALRKEGRIAKVGDRWYSAEESPDALPSPW